MRPQRILKSLPPGLIAIIATITAVGISFSLAMPLLAIVMENRGIDTVTAGLNAATAGLATLFMAPLTPGLIKRFGAARLASACIAIAAILFVGFYLFESMAVWFPLRIIFHSCITAAFVISEFWIIAVSPDDRRGLVLGFYTTILVIGFGIGPALVAAIGSEGAMPFLVGSAILLVASLPAWMARKKAPKVEESGVGDFVGALWAVPSATVAGFVFGFFESGEMAFLAIYGLRIGLPEAHAAGLLTATALGAALFTIPAGALSDRFDKRVMMIICAAAGGAFIAALPLAGTSLIIIYLLLALHSATAGPLYALGLSHLGAKMTGDALAAASAAFVFMYAMGMTAGPGLIGFAMDQYGENAIPAVVAVLLIGFAAFVALRMIKSNGSAA